MFICMIWCLLLYPFNNVFRNHAPGPHGLAIKHHPLGDDAYYILGHKLIAVIIHNSCFICFTVRPRKQASMVGTGCDDLSRPILILYI